MRSESKRLFLPAIVVGVLGFLVWRFLSNDALPVARQAPRDAAERNQLESAAAATVEPAPDVSRESPSSPERTANRPLRAQLHGYVCDRAQQLIPDATIRFVDRGAPTAAGARGSNAAATGGPYVIPGLCAGLVDFRVQAKGCQPLDVTVDCGEGGALRHDFVLDRSILIPIRVVKPDGAQLFGEPPSSVPSPPPDERLTELEWGLAVVASDGPLPPPLPTTGASWHGLGHGRFKKRSQFDPSANKDVPADAIGLLEVGRTPVEVTLLFKHVVLGRATASGAAPITFTVDDTTIERSLGRIVLACVDAVTGAPIAQARVAATDDSRSSRGTPTGDDGSAQLEHVAPGFVHLNIEPPAAYARVTCYVRVEPGTTTDLGDIALEPTVTLRGKVVDSTGKPVAAQMQALALDGRVAGEPFGSNEYFVADPNGKVELALGRGRWLVRASSGRDAKAEIAREIVDVGAGDPPPIALQLLPATFVTIDARLAPNEVRHVEIVTADGSIEFANLWNRDARSFQLLPGAYVFRAYDGTRVIRSAAFTVGDAPIRVEFSLADDAEPKVGLGPSAWPQYDEVVGGPVVKPTAYYVEPAATTTLTLSGTLRDRAGAPIPLARISATDTENTSRPGTVGSDGSFAIAAVPTGWHDVVASADGFLPESRRIELAGSGAPPLEITLVRLTRVKVRATDLAGRPFVAAIRKHFGHGASPQALVVTVTREAPGDRLPAGLSGAGKFSPAWNDQSNELGTLDSSTPPPFFVTIAVGDFVLATQELPAPRDEMLFAIDPSLLDRARGTLRFRLIDARTGEGITKAFAGVTGLNGSMHGEAQELPASAGGVWTLEGLQPGRRNLCVTVDESSFLQLPIDVAAGGVTELGDLRIVRGVTLDGVVVNEAGAPLDAELRVVDYGADGMAIRDGGVYMVKTDAQGRFQLQAARPRIRLETRGDGFALDPVVVDVLQAASGELRVVLRRGVPVVLRPRLAADETQRVRIERGDGEPLTSRTLTGSLPSTIRLAPGKFRLRIERADGSTREQAFTVADAPLDVEIE